jgi:hypothetical protein
MNLKTLGKSLLYTLGVTAGIAAWILFSFYAPSWLTLGVAIAALWFMMYKFLKD